jgi:hypothetical protein
MSHSVDIVCTTFTGLLNFENISTFSFFDSYLVERQLRFSSNISTFICIITYAPYVISTMEIHHEYVTIKIVGISYYRNRNTG